MTLIELMVTLTVAGVLIALAAPSFSRIVAQNRAATQTNELVGILHLARSEAIRRGLPVTFRSGAASEDFAASGWTVFADADGDGTFDSSTDTELRKTTGLPSGVEVKRVTATAGTPPTYADNTGDSDRMYLTFNSRGALGGAATSHFRVCAGDGDDIGRVVQISVTGRISLATTKAAC